MTIRSTGDLAETLERDLPAPLLAALRQAASIAGEQGIPCYLVGGPVRDLILGRPVDDVDLVLEGDAIAVADRFAALAGGRPVRHLAFGTAKVALVSEGRDFVVDFVTARSERYPEPAALPVVQPGRIEDDLRRRDFTVNTLAVSLDPQRWGQVIDRCNGLDDLRAGRIRVLHDRSFVDDPTRLLRAARFATRLDFPIEQHTRDLMLEAARGDMVERTSPIRILHEVWLVFKEPDPAGVLRLLDDLAVLPRVIPGLRVTPEVARIVTAARGLDLEHEERRKVLLGIVAWALSEEGRVAFLHRYPLSAAEQQLVAELGRLDAVVEQLARVELRPSELDRLLRGLSDTTLQVAELVGAGLAARRITDYRDVVRHVRPLLTGDDLRRLNIPPGPRYRALLDGLRAAQLDGEITSRGEAEAWVRGQPM